MSHIRPTDEDSTADTTVRRRAVIYCRTAGPASSATAAHHAGQEETCRREAKRLGLEVVAVVHDAAQPAGLDTGKPGWRRVEAMVRGRQVAVVLTSRIDRLTRSWTEYGFLMSLGDAFDVEFRTPPGASSQGVSPWERRLTRSLPPLERRRPRPPLAPGHPRSTEGNH